MAFTDETSIREHLAGISADVLSSELIQSAISSAHQEILRDLSNEWENSEDPNLKLAETELATSHLFRALSKRQGVEQTDVVTPLLKLYSASKWEDLLEQAIQEEARARGRLQPFLELPVDPFAFNLE